MAGARITGGIVGPLIGGILANRLTLAAPLWMACGLAMLATIASLFLTETAPARRAG